MEVARVPLEPFTYALPPERIAQRPCRPYDTARLLVVSRENGVLREVCFTQLPELLGPQDVLVFNRSQVIPARLFGTLPTGAQIEVLLLQEESSSEWICLAKPLRKLSPGMQLNFSEQLIAEVCGRAAESRVRLRFTNVDGATSQRSLILEHGSMPIPPYIRDGRGDSQDVADYQPHFAAVQGSVAAPTASLHFTPELLERLGARGVGLEFVVLHVGLASVQPLSRPGQVGPPQPPPERYHYDGALLERLQAARRAGRRVIAVGTTVVRALESMVRSRSSLADEPIEREASIFIAPGFPFHIVDGMVTNFHQSGSSHLLLVEAFMGRKLLERSYHHALASGFRFLSYGDGMAVL